MRTNFDTTSSKMNELICTLLECQTVNKYCFNACLEDESVSSLTECVRLNAECAEVCGIALSLITYSDGVSGDFAAICANICRRCAEECRRHDQFYCIECSKACIDCAILCEEYIKISEGSYAA